MVVHLTQHFRNVFVFFFNLITDWCHVPDNNFPRLISWFAMKKNIPKSTLQTTNLLALPEQLYQFFFLWNKYNLILKKL